jgi:GR25 family glycosyltransferase involved in LPS biosynthesis
MDPTIYGPVLINLEKRKDRLTESDAEFKTLNMPFIRLNATEAEDKAMACQDSHCRALELFLKTPNEFQACFICEDDVKFLCDAAQLKTHIDEFMQNPYATALCLGYSSREHYEYSPRFWKTTDNQTRTAYIIKRSLAPDLLDLWRRLYVLRVSGDYKKTPNWYSTLFKSLPLKTHPIDIYRGDQCWKILQHTHRFLIPKNPLAIQRASYSDIECKPVNYLT